MYLKYRAIYCCLSIGLLTGCETTTNVSNNVKNIDLPTSWSEASKSTLNKDVQPLFNYGFNDNTLINLITEGVRNNYLLQNQQSQVELLQLALNISKSEFYPLVTLTTNQNRRKTGEETYSSNAEINANISYELDIWGKLSASKQNAALQFASEQAAYQSEVQKLVTQISSSWYNLIEANLLVDLFQKRVNSLKTSHEIIDRSYKLGLSSALDVYLSQNNLLQERSRLIQQGQLLKQSKHKLNLLLGRNPNSHFEIPANFPKLEGSASLVVPTELLSRRADIKSEWLQLLSLDKSVAVAHKQRFPKLSLTINSGYGADKLSNLTDSTTLLWSLAANLAGPIFDAGKLANMETQAKIKLFQAEQSYLDNIWSAISEVELLLSESDMLLAQKKTLTRSEKNANAAERLAFNQYQKGLVNYSTVLEAQRRAFDSKTSILQNKNKIIQNQISLNLALGGENNTAIISGGNKKS